VRKEKKNRNRATVLLFAGDLPHLKQQQQPQRHAPHP